MKATEDLAEVLRETDSEARIGGKNQRNRHLLTKEVRLLKLVDRDLARCQVGDLLPILADA